MRPMGDPSGDGRRDHPRVLRMEHPRVLRLHSRTAVDLLPMAESGDLLCTELNIDRKTSLSGGFTRLGRCWDDNTSGIVGAVSD